MSLIERSDAVNALAHYFSEDYGEPDDVAREYAEYVIGNVKDASCPDCREAAKALRAITIYAASPHPEPCGTDACVLCLIEGTTQNAISPAETGGA